MLQSRGLRLALAGFALLLLGAAMLLLSKIVAVVMMLSGGMAVWSGFIWTLFQYYVPPQPPD
jgi:hypothetical protein